MGICQKKYLLITVVLVTSLMFAGCCRRNNSEIPGASRREVVKQSPASVKTGQDGRPVPEKPLPLLDGTGLNYSVDASPGTVKKRSSGSGGSGFERKYLQGVELMENGDFPQAINVFEEILKSSPGTEEASIAELCIAELYFRTKSNERALAAYERIVAKYPNSHAAENARAGIEYLMNISRYEDEYVSPDVEGRKRRGY